MMATAKALSAEDAAIVRDFLLAMTDAVDNVDRALPGE